MPKWLPILPVIRQVITTDAKDYYRDFRDADLGGTQPAVKPEEMLRVMKVMDSAFISGNEHRSVSVHI